MKKVAIFTTFFEAASGYSLVGVAETQIKALLDHGYDPMVLVQSNFEQPDPVGVWSDSIVDLRPVVPEMHLDAGLSENFGDRVKAILGALSENLEGVDVCITHDIVLQEFYKEHNVAMRLYAETRPDLLWLHWIHSCPGGSTITVPKAAWATPKQCRHQPVPGYIVYPNGTDKGIVCRTYKMSSKFVKTCRSGHAIDPLAIWPYDRLTRDLAQRADLLSGEVVAVYPVRLDRGKNVEKIVRLMSGVACAGYDARLLVIDWQSAHSRFQEYIDELLDLAEELGLKGKVNFTSRLDDRCSQGVPRRVVIELMDLSNIYVHPSKVETYGLTVHEAMLRGNLICLNHDFEPMRELFGDSAIYFDFGSDRRERTAYSPDEQTFWNDEAKRLIMELKSNQALMARTKARREWNPMVMFKDFESLLHLKAVPA